MAIESVPALRCHCYVHCVCPVSEFAEGVGRGRKEPDFDSSKLISRPRPEYPEAARRYKLSSIVLFQTEIDEAGNVAALRILTPAGAGFDESAAEAVYQWKYSPTLVAGKPTRVITTITVNFTFVQ